MRVILLFKTGHVVLRLPLDHCILSSLELTCSQLIGYVSHHNTTYKLTDIKQLIEKVVSETTADKWCHCIEHIIKEEDMFWELAHIVVVDSLIIESYHCGQTSDSSDETSSEKGLNYFLIATDNRPIVYSTLVSNCYSFYFRFKTVHILFRKDIFKKLNARFIVTY